MTSVSAGHVILTLTQPVGSGRPKNRNRNPDLLDQKSCALLTELPCPQLFTNIIIIIIITIIIIIIIIIIILTIITITIVIIIMIIIIILIEIIIIII